MSFKVKSLKLQFLNIFPPLKQWRTNFCIYHFFCLSSYLSYFHSFPVKMFCSLFQFFFSYIFAGFSTIFFFIVHLSFSSAKNVLCTPNRNGLVGLVEIYTNFFFPLFFVFHKKQNKVAVYLWWHSVFISDFIVSSVGVRLFALFVPHAFL